MAAVPRYRLLAVAAFVLAAATWAFSGRPIAKRPRSRWLRASAFALWGILLAFSLWLDTETGVYLMLATVGGGLIISIGHRSRLLGILGALGAMVGTIVLVSVVSFGTGAFARSYWQGFVDPLYSYQAGLGAVPLRLWPLTDPGLTLIAVVLSPCLAAVTIALVLLQGRLRTPLERSPARKGAIAMIAILALLFPLKYVNQSVVYVWLASGSWTFALIGYWVARILRVNRARVTTGDPGLRWMGIGLAAVVVAYCWLLPVVVFDHRQPDEYGWSSYRHFPSVVTRTLGIYQAPEWDASQIAEVTEADLDFVRKLSLREQRVAVYGESDWIVDMRADKASYFRVSPSAEMFDRRQISNPCVPDVVFVQRSGTAGFGSTPLSVVCPEFTQQFTKVGESDTLLGYVRKPRD